MASVDSRRELPALDKSVEDSYRSGENDDHHGWQDFPNHESTTGGGEGEGEGGPIEIDEPAQHHASTIQIAVDNSSNSSRVGAFRSRPGRRRNHLHSNIPALARKRISRGVPIALSTEEGSEEDNDELELDNDRDESCVAGEQNGLAYCVETGEHVDVRQMPIATAYLVDENNEPQDDEENSSYNSRLKKVIPPDPKFMIHREGPTNEVIDSLLLSSASHDEGTNDSSGSSAVTVISGMGGLGKSVIAAAAVKHSRVSESFSDGVSWLPLGPNQLTPVSYRNSLRTLCSQILMNEEGIHDVIDKLSGYPFSLCESDQAARVDFNCLRAIVESLVDSKKIVIVLDDVWHDSDISLFDFGKECHLLVTTRKQNIAETTQSYSRSPSLEFGFVHLQLPNDEESLQILENVVGKCLTNNCELCPTEDAKEIIRRCHRLPLSIVTVGLLMRGCENFDSLPSSIILKSLEPPGGGDIGEVNVHSSCYHIFDQSFKSLGQGNKSVEASLRLCFAAFSACFTNSSGRRALVPCKVAQNFFAELLSGHKGYLTKEQLNELRCRNITAKAVIKKLRSIGFLDFHQETRGGLCVIVHHDLQQEYGMKTAIIFEEGWKSNTRYNGRDRSSDESARARANEIIVAVYEKKVKKKKWWQLSKEDDWSLLEGEEKDYVIEFILAHMVLANRHKKALKTLVNQSFANERMEGAAAGKFRAWVIEEMRFAARVASKYHLSLFFWIKAETVHQTAMIETLIKLKNHDEKNNLWFQATDAALTWFLRSKWPNIINLMTNNSPTNIIMRKLVANHAYKMSTLLAQSGLGDRPYAMGWHALFLFREGRIDEAHELRKQVLELVQEVLPEDHVVVLFEIVQIMQVCLAIGDYKQAIFYGNKVLSGVRLRYGVRDSTELASSLAISGECHWFEGRMQESMELFQQAQAMYERLEFKGGVLSHVQDRLKNILYSLNN